MDRFANETLFYGGMALAAASAALAVVFAFIMLAKWARLKARFDKEYGEPPKRGA